MTAAAVGWVLLGVLLLPLVTYVTVKLGTAGFFRGRKAYEEWLAEQKRFKRWEDDDGN